MRLSLLALIVAVLVAACSTTETRPQPDSAVQLTPFIGARWLASSSHAYHAIDWKNGGSSRRTSFVGDFGEGPTLVLSNRCAGNYRTW